MSWIDNDDLLGMEYFSRGNSKPLFNNEDSFSLFNLEKENKHSTDDYQINYEDFALNKKGGSPSLMNCYSPLNSLKNENVEKPGPEKNIFIKRTYVDTFDLDKLRYLEDELVNKSGCRSFKEKMRKKRERTKFLLSKTRRDSGSLSDKINENSDVKVTSTKFGSNSSTEKIKLKEELVENNSNQQVNEMIMKKAMKMQKNREAAQKSRMYKKLHIEMLKNKESILVDENIKLKKELENIKNAAKLVCEKCKNIFKEKNSSQNLEKKSSAHKTNFKVVQTTPIMHSTQLSSVSKYTIFTGLLVIVCLIGNFHWSSPNQNNSLTNHRILMETFNSSLTEAEEIKLPILPNIADVKHLPPIVIDDKIQNKSLYVKFIDYIKWKTGFTKAPEYNTTDSENNKSNLKKNFLSKDKEQTSEIKETNNIPVKTVESCKNNITFIPFPIEKDVVHKHDTIEEKAQTIDNRKIQENRDNNTCNTTKFKGYFDFEFSNSNESCKSCASNLIENLNGSKSSNFLNSDSKSIQKFDPLFFKIVIPVEKENKIDSQSLSSFIVDLMHKNNNFNESLVIEKNSKMFYYEIECVIYDVNKFTK